jgi:endonuclease YncB( thermonuclease family)
MRIHLVAPLFALLVVAGSAACAGDRPVLQGVVVGVIDGDTADVRLDSGMIRIRFHAIDAPESGQPNGKAARTALSQLIFGKAVEVEPFEQDRYDRLVARVWLDGQDINAEMIKTGNAWAYRRYADEPAYCAYEQAARDLGRGLWRLPPGDRVAPWEWRQRKSRAGRFTDYSQETVAACVAALGH